MDNKERMWKLGDYFDMHWSASLGPVDESSNIDQIFRTRTYLGCSCSSFKKKITISVCKVFVLEEKKGEAVYEHGLLLYKI